MIGKLIKSTRRLEQHVQRLRPVSSPGVLTNRTQRGVSKTPRAKATQPTNTQNIIPRWG